GTDDAQTDARSVRVLIRSGAVPNDLRERIEIDGRGLIAAEAQEDLEPPPRLPRSANRRRARFALVRTEYRVAAKKSSRQNNRVLESTMRLLSGHLLALLDGEPRSHRVGDALAQKAAEPLTRCVEARSVVQPAHNGQHLVEGYIHDNSRRPGRMPCRLARLGRQRRAFEQRLA